MEPNTSDVHEYTQDFRKKVIESFGNSFQDYDFITTYQSNKKNPKDFKFRVYPKSTYTDEELSSEWNYLINAEKKIREKIGLKPNEETSKKWTMIEIANNQKRHGLLRIEKVEIDEKTVKVVSL